MQINWLAICAEAIIGYFGEIYDNEGMVRKFQDITESAVIVAESVEASENHEDKKQAAILYSSGLGLLLQETFQYRLVLQASRCRRFWKVFLRYTGVKKVTLSGITFR
jgi:hypothetical protein